MPPFVRDFFLLLFRGIVNVRDSKTQPFDLGAWVFDWPEHEILMEVLPAIAFLIDDCEETELGQLYVVALRLNLRWPAVAISIDL